MDVRRDDGNGVCCYFWTSVLVFVIEREMRSRGEEEQEKCWEKSCTNHVIMRLRRGSGNDDY